MSDRDNPANVGTPVVTVQEFNPVVVSLDGTNADTIVTTGRTIVRGVYINTTLSSEPVELITGANAIIAIPGEAPAGSWFPLGDVAFADGLTVSPGAAATGELVVIYKAIV